MVDFLLTLAQIVGAICLWRGVWVSSTSLPGLLCTGAKHLILTSAGSHAGRVVRCILGLQAIMLAHHHHHQLQQHLRMPCPSTPAQQPEAPERWCEQGHAAGLQLAQPGSGHCAGPAHPALHPCVSHASWGLLVSLGSRCACADLWRPCRLRTLRTPRIQGYRPRPHRRRALTVLLLGMCFCGKWILVIVPVNGH